MKKKLVLEDQVALVHISVRPIGHLFDFPELLLLDLRGSELHRIVSELEERLNFHFCGNSTR